MQRLSGIDPAMIWIGKQAAKIRRKRVDDRIVSDHFCCSSGIAPILHYFELGLVQGGTW